MPTKSNDLRFSPSIFILSTLLGLGICFPIKAETVSSVSRLPSGIVTQGAALLKDLQLTKIAQNQKQNNPGLPKKRQFEGNVELPEYGSVEQKRSPVNSKKNQNSTPSSPSTRVLVSEVLVKGANPELKDIIYGAIETKPGRTTTRNQLQQDLNAVYATGYFQNVEVNPEDTSLGVRIAFVVKPNPTLNRVRLKTASQKNSQILPPAKVKQIFGEDYGKILNLRELQQGIIKVNEWYSKNGYELAQVVGAPQIGSEGNVTLIVAEGVIEDIRVRYFDEDDRPIKGKTREFIITREIELESGKVFQQNTAQQDLRRLYGLGIFQDARLSFSPGEDPNQVIVNVDIVEDSGGQLDFGGGYSSDTGLLGTVGYQQKNLGGNNQTLGSEISISDDDLLFDLSFTDPWIASSDTRTSYTVNAFRSRSTSLVFNGDNDIDTDNGSDTPRIVRTGGGIRLARPIASDPFERQKWLLSSALKYQRVAVNNRDGDVAPLSEDPTPNDGTDDRRNLAFSDDGTDDLFSLGFNATRDRLNNRLQPTEGSLLKLGTEQTLPIGSGNILLNRVTADYSHFFPVDLIGFSDEPETIAFNIQAGTILGDLPPYEAFILGGANSVRGFNDGEVGSGRSRFQASAEYRFPVFKIVRGAVFFDYGTTLGSGSEVPGEPSVVRELPGSAYGYGMGIRINTPVAPIRLDYAINDDGDNMIQFGFGEKF